MDFTIKGTFKAGQKWEKFIRTITSPTRNAAFEKILSIIGSEHRCKRNRIKIDSIDEAA